MSVAKIVLSVIVLICCLLLVLVVELQSGKSAGLSGSLGGSFDTYLGKNKSNSADARLARLTKWIGIVFMVCVLILNLI